MDTEQPHFVIAKDLSFSGVLHDVKRSQNSLQPIFEAFTNALEAIKIKKIQSKDFVNGRINISIYTTELTDQNVEFKSLTIKDDGIGFNDQEFKRFNTFKDNTKGFKNLGSGRLQYVHSFDKTKFTSVFLDDGKFYERKFSMSKNSSYLTNNAIVKAYPINTSSDEATSTKVEFIDLLEKSNIYNNLDDKSLKESLIKRYLHFFCFNPKNIPEITIDYYVQGTLKSTSTISFTDIPKFDRKETIKVNYSKTSEDNTKYELTSKSEDFDVTTFRVTKNLLENNDLKLISKGEVVDDTKINLLGISRDENVKGFKYLVLVAGDYIDAHDTNLRGELNIPSRTADKGFNLFTQETIFIEDIEKTVNTELSKLYPEIEEVKVKHQENIKELKDMFLIDDDTDVEVSFNDDNRKILEKYYEAQAKKEANVDAKIKQTIDKLDDLDTSAANYEEELEKEINKLVKIIPEQNKRTLSHYVARRKLVLELFNKILDKKLKIQNGETRDKEESLIHNLLFHQKSTNSYDSDLWIINEEFIYFKGNSEFKLKDLEIGGKKVFKSDFEEEEKRYLLSLGENRIEKRPDVLLFPEEGKCIIIEFKAPKVNASDHLTQINKYASFIRNYTTDDFEIKIFYGYLIGEGIEPRDILGSVSTFEHSHNFDYLYSPSQKVIGFDTKENGSIYTEVLKYSSLLKRAQLRNKIFIEKLGLK